MAACGQIEPHIGVAGLQQREKNSLIGLGARIGLHIGVGTAKKLLGAINGEIFRNVDILTAAIVTLARITLRIFVGQHGPLSLKHRFGNDVF